MSVGRAVVIKPRNSVQALVISSPLYRAREMGYDIWVYGIDDYYKYLYYKKKMLVFKFVKKKIAYIQDKQNTKTHSTTGALVKIFNGHQRIL